MVREASLVPGPCLCPGFVLRFHTTSDKQLCGELGRKLMGTFTSLVPMQTVPTSGFRLLAVCKNEGKREGLGDLVTCR